MTCCFLMEFGLHKLRSNDLSLSRLQQDMVRLTLWNVLSCVPNSVSSHVFFNLCLYFEIFKISTFEKNSYIFKMLTVNKENVNAL